MAAQIIYVPAGSPVTLAFARGPVNFAAGWEVRGSRNVASSGAAVETVTQNRDLMLSWEMPHLVVADDIEAWESFLAFALTGATWKFYPAAAIDYWMNCVMETQSWAPARNAPRKYGAAFKARVLEDGQTPAGPAQVLRRFYGIA